MVSNGIQMGFVVVVVAYEGMEVRKEKTTSGPVTVLCVAVWRVPKKVLYRQFLFLHIYVHTLGKVNSPRE